MSLNEMDDIINDFIVEAGETLDGLDRKFLALEKSPRDATLLNDIFRSMHTIKGAAGFLGFQQMVEVSHVAEDVLNRLRKGEMVADAAIMDALLHSVDMVKRLLRNIKDKNSAQENIEPITNALKAVLAHAPHKAQDAAKPSVATPSDAKESQEATLRDKETSLRVDIERLDAVLNLAGELVLSRNRLLRLGSKVHESRLDDALSSQLGEALASLDLVTSDLQLAVMKMRMQPIAKVFNRFPRMVRDLARQHNKEIELVVTGQETELDKTVIEEIGDPLVHLIRNAVDHGMEETGERASKGKPRTGTIRLSASQEGRNILVSVSDDGRGMDPSLIKRSAMDKGLISAGEAEALSAREALNLIFIPGFSTAKKVSNLSGRGVGMDVVKTNISRINGSIGIESEPGKGTKIEFRLPLTLAIIQALTVEVNGEVYGIPLSTVVENIRIRTDEIKTVNGKEVIHLRNRVFPVMRLGSLVSASEVQRDSAWKYIVIAGIGERSFGLLVDKLNGQEEIVMKSMGEYLKGTEGIAGACITGDGNVILILDVAGLLEALARTYAY
ncbi:MAG: chemotaxis protein CheA [Deltaproteobacteria bacterium]|nr:chemotaxis protein CheA [Deltaproteobacteria bacterium]